MRTLVSWGYETEANEMRLRAAVAFLVLVLVLVVAGSMKGCKGCKEKSASDAT